MSYDEGMEADIIWHDVSIQSGVFSKLKNFQRCNHFPGTYNLARKNQLGMNIEKMKKISAEREKDYAFNPKTWCLPADYRDLRTFFGKTSDEDEDGKGVRTFIAKPEGSC